MNVFIAFHLPINTILTSTNNLNLKKKHKIIFLYDKCKKNIFKIKIFSFNLYFQYLLYLYNIFESNKKRNILPCIFWVEYILLVPYYPFRCCHSHIQKLLNKC